MINYLVRRLLLSIPILLGVTVVAFVALDLAPGDAADALINPLDPLPPAQMEQLRERMGLNKPLPVRYVIWLGQTVQGNLGWSIADPEPVAAKLKRRLGNTVILVSTSTIVAFGIGLFLGTVTAIRKYSIFDYITTLFVYASISVPGFFAGLLAIFLFAVRLGWFPAGGIRSLEPTLPPVLDVMWHLFLPTIVLALNDIATYTRYMRTSMLDVMNMDYVRTARSKGLTERIVTGRHVIKNAMLPVVTLAGLRMRRIFSGALLIEVIFSWPGVGSLAYTAIQKRDYPVVMGTTLFLGLIVVLANLLTDLVYTVVDPRIRYD